MEDAHITEPNFDNDTSLFAIFDGHGGRIKYFIYFRLKNTWFQSLKLSLKIRKRVCRIYSIKFS